MSRLSPANVELAREIIGRYPVAKSALIPLCHLAQEQDGWLTDDAMAHIAELVGVTSAEVLGTASFYEMFRREPTGRYLVNVCTNLSCQLLGADEVVEAIGSKLGIHPGQTTADGTITLSEAECQAACSEAPCIQVNYRYFYRLTPDGARRLIDDLRAGALDREVPPHGTTTRVRQTIPADRFVGPQPPAAVTEAPIWLRSTDEGGGS